MRLGKNPKEEGKNPFKKMNDGVVIARNMVAGAAAAAAVIKLALPRILKNISDE
jgi:hypothetical protein